MVLMAGMLPGVECARRRRLRQGGSSSGAAEAPCGTRRPSFCLYAAGHGSSASSVASKERSSVCKEMMMACAWTLDSNAREAKERLDQKLRGQRESVVAKRHQMSTGTVRPLTAAKPVPHVTSTSAAGTDASSSSSTLHHPATTAAELEGATPPCALQREVFSFSKTASGGGAGPRRRRFCWRRLGRRRTPPREAEAWECAVCLEEVRVGDVVAHLPCAHRFHWSCAVPWVRAASRCPVCRAQVHLAPSTSPS